MTHIRVRRCDVRGWRVASQFAVFDLPVLPAADTGVPFRD